MRAWCLLGVTLVCIGAALTLLRNRENEEMFVHLGGRDFRSLPT